MKKKTEAKPSRLTLRGWAVLDDLQRQVKNRAQEGAWFQVPSIIFEAIRLSAEVDEESFWMDVVELYTKVIEVNQPTKKFPILSTKRKETNPLPWEYEGRGWYFWLNLFSKNYGWSEEQIGSMDIDSAIGLYQEIMIDQQLDQEWEWGLSEVAYSYVKETKKMKFNKLPRPDWMKPVMGKAKPVKTYRMPVAALPMGSVVILDEQPSEELQLGK